MPKNENKVVIKKYKITLPFEEPRRVIIDIGWIHPDDINKIQVDKVKGFREKLNMDEEIFLLYRNLMLEAGFVPVAVKGYKVVSLLSKGAIKYFDPAAIKAWKAMKADFAKAEETIVFAWKKD